MLTSLAGTESNPAMVPPLSRTKLSEWVNDSVKLLSKAVAGSVWSGLHGRMQLAKVVLLCRGDNDETRSIVTTQVLPQDVVQALTENPNDPTLGAAFSPNSKAGNPDPRVSALVLSELSEPRGVYKFETTYVDTLKQFMVGLYPNASLEILSLGEANSEDKKVGQVEDVDDLPSLN